MYPVNNRAPDTAMHRRGRAQRGRDGEGDAESGARHAAEDRDGDEFRREVAEPEREEPDAHEVPPRPVGHESLDERLDHAVDFARVEVARHAHEGIGDAQARDDERDVLAVMQNITPI